VKAEIVTCEEGRVIVSRIAPMGDRSVCLELHRGDGKVTVTVAHMILTTDEAREVGRALAEIAGSG